MNRRGFLLVAAASIPLVGNLNTHNGSTLSATVPIDVLRKIQCDCIGHRNGIKSLKWTRVFFGDSEMAKVVVEFKS